MEKMHQGIWLCKGILVISSATNLIIYPHYEELNCSKFLCSLCTEYFRLLLATPTLYTRSVRKANKQENLTAVFWHHGLFQYPRTMTL